MLLLAQLDQNIFFFVRWNESSHCSLTDSSSNSRFMFRLNTIITVFQIKNVNLSNINQYLFEINWSTKRQSNWLSIQCDIDNLLYFIDDDCSCVIRMHTLKSFDKKFNDFFEDNLNRYRWQDRKCKDYFRTEGLVCFLIDSY